MTTFSFTLGYAGILSEVKKQLSVIGKHSRDEKGDSLYDIITVGSNEEPMFEGFMSSAVKTVVGASGQFLTGVNYQSSPKGATLSYRVPDSQLPVTESVASELCNIAKEYIISYCLLRWMSHVAPQTAGYYTSDCQLHMSEFNALLYQEHTKVPSAFTVKSLNNKS